MSTKYRTAPVPSEELPKGIPYIIGNEAAERFSFYGMRAILAVFLTEYLLDPSGQLSPMDEHTANVWQHSFVAATYALPIIGAILSDWLLGKYRTIISLSIVYCAGHAVMAMVDSPAITHIDPRWTLAAALGLIAIGAGGIKPCVSAHVGDQFGSRNRHLIGKIFGWFYFSINLGSTISTLLTPKLLEWYGPGVAFGVPGVLMGLATFVFWLGRHKFVHVPAGGKAFFRETLSMDGLRALKYLIPLYLILIPFWSLFDQTQSSWVHQAKHLDREILGYVILPSQIQAANPILVMIFIPLFSYVVYPLVGRVVEVTPLRKIGAGLFLTVPAFALVGWLQHRLDTGETPHIGWQLLAYVIMTAAEVLVSITSLEFSYTQAPRKMKSLLMGLYLLLGISLGNIFTTVVNEVILSQEQKGNPILEGAKYFWFFTYVMLGAAALFLLLAKFYRGQTYIQEESELPEAELRGEQVEGELND